MELIEVFIETTRSDLINLQSGINNKNIDVIAGIAHSLKGAAMNLGLDNFLKLAQKIEKTAHDGELEKTARTVEIFREELADFGNLQAS